MKFKYKILLLLLLLAAGKAFAQGNLGKANRLYNGQKFALALQEYEQNIKPGKVSLATAERMATAYRLVNNSAEAEKWYARVVAFPESNVKNLFFYGQSLQSNGKYNEAKGQYQEYVKKVPADARRINTLLAGIESAKRWQARPELVKINAVPTLNSTAADFSPVYLNQGILFTSDRPKSVSGQPEAIYGWTGRPYLSQYFAAIKKDKTLAPPVPYDSVFMGPLHQGPAAVSGNGQVFFITQSKWQKSRTRVVGDPTRWANPSKANLVNRFELYWRERKNGKWSPPQAFAHNNALLYSVGHPALSADGNLLYFASDMPGGHGQTDIYYSQRQADGSWGKPVNAGPGINTTERESFPGLGPDGTLYFASDGHPGMGGLDLFSAIGSKNVWNALQNLKAPLNSPKDDFGILFDPSGQEGYLSSSRNTSDGTDEILKFQILEKPVFLIVTATERNETNRRGSSSSALPDVRLMLKPQTNKDSVVAITNIKGRSLFEISHRTIYALKGTKTGYLNRSIVVNPAKTKPGDTLRVNLVFNKNQVEQAIVLENIYFDLDKSDIREDAARELDDLVQVLKDNPRIKIEMSAHTDSREGFGYNLKLSQRRAQATVSYLVSKGIPANRLKAKGYGKTRLVNQCKDGVICSEEEHQINRRTEFKIIK